eukprot:1257981-Prymnesium_polylepis.1
MSGSVRLEYWCCSKPRPPKLPGRLPLDDVDVLLCAGCARARSRPRIFKSRDYKDEAAWILHIRSTMQLVQPE